METKIKWNEGDGYITATYEGSGNGSASISSDVNEGIDREQSIKVETTDKSISATLLITQEGLREIFQPSDGDFTLADGGNFNVIKGEIPYTELSYIESTGVQYIDTGFNINTSTDEIELEIEGVTTTVYKWFFGEHDNNARFGIGSGDGVNKRNIAYGNNTYKVSDTQIYNSKHKFVANKEGVYLDGLKISNYSSFASTSTLYLFHLNLNNQSSYMGGARIWSYKHRRDGNTLIELIPVRDLNGIVCMYDKVSRSFFRNQGDGEFLGGPSITPNIPSDCTLLDYIESSGIQYIDTGMLSTA